MGRMVQAPGKERSKRHKKDTKNKSKQIFTIYTTAIGFVEETGKGMIDRRENLYFNSYKYTKQL